MKELPILVVEDDLALREALVDTLELAGVAVRVAGDGEEALAVLRREPVGLVLSDAQMQPMDGYRLFFEMRQRRLQVPFMLMTAHGAIDRAVDLLRAGACHYLTKPFEPSTLLVEVEKHRLKLPEVPESDDGQQPVAHSPVMRELLKMARKVAASEATVLITGESGVGKEVMARFLHANSPRANHPFVAVNCAAIPESLFESVLFGHEKGAFTGALSSHAGKFEQAQGGTLLLDEISEMSAAMQAKLLRVIQEREVERVGGQRPVRLHVRFLATTNRDLAAEVAAGRVRADLYYRIHVFEMNIPPLRQRREDILPLACNYLKRHDKSLNFTDFVITDAAAAKLTAHDWPGNIRELENVLQRAEILAEAGVVDADCLHWSGSLIPLSCQGVLHSGDVLPVHVPEQPVDMKSLEKQHIVETLRTVGGVRRLAAERLGISERTLRYKLARWREAGEIDLATLAGERHGEDA